MTWSSRSGRKYSVTGAGGGKVNSGDDILEEQHRRDEARRRILSRGATSARARGDLRSHASAWVTIVCRSSKCGCQPSVERIRSQAATICAGSPARREVSWTLKSTPDTRLTVSITSSTSWPCCRWCGHCGASPPARRFEPHLQDRRFQL